jgi:CheY-like chemotaxis protein
MEAIGHLTGGVAHDFNNLLMAIQGSLELLKRRLPADPQLSMFLDNALQGAQRGAALTQRMLAFARRQELNLKAVDVVLLVRDMTNLLQSSLGSSVQIETRFPLSLPMINADSNQLELALLNLAMNARDAMPRGGSITIAAHERTVENDQALKPGRYLCLAVTDTGTGMDEKTLLHAIEPFYTTKGVGKGTGLGLPMVHGMAEQSGGKLLLKSSPGKGTTAELCLPVASSEGTTPTPTAAAAHAPKIRALTIISVDDDPLVAFNTCAMLEDLGHKVHCVSSGAEALNLLRQYNDIDLLVTDQAMPGMTGSELAKVVKAEWPRLAILIATGYAELPDGLGRDIPKLAKPFFQEDLANAIAALRHFSTN